LAIWRTAASSTGINASHSEDTPRNTERVQWHLQLR
jgi:hypothetical protein